MLVLFTDTDTDITPELAEFYGYNLISMPYVVDQKEVYPYVDFKTFDAHGFYDMLRGGVIPQTCGISPQAYINYFEPFFKRGDDILYVHFSRAMSGTFNAMDIALKELAQRYPDRKFFAVDTKGITTLSLNIAKEVGDLYKAGKSGEEIVEWAKREVDKFAIFFYADDLKFFRRSGRVTNLAATMGNIMGVHPVLHMGKDGMMATLTKAIGRKSTLKKIVDYVEQLQDDIKSHRVIIGHSDCKQIADILAQMLKERFGDDLNIEFAEVNPTAGSHCGPDGVGVCFHCTQRL